MSEAFDETMTILEALGRQLDGMVRVADRLSEHALAAYLCHALNSVDLALQDKGREPPPRLYED